MIWRLGYQGDFALTNALVPTDDPSLWFSFQHFPSLITQNGPQTMLAIWDNGDNRVLNTNGEICGGSSGPCVFFPPRPFFSSMRVPWSPICSGPILCQYFGFWGGSINQLGNGNVEFDLNDPIIPPSAGVASQIQEITQTANPQVVWQMDITPITSNAYRAYRVPSLYPGVTWQY